MPSSPELETLVSPYTGLVHALSEFLRAPDEPRFPSFKGIMAAKKKEVTTLTLAEIGVEADEVGVANAGTKVTASTPKPPKTAGEKVTDEGDGGTKVAEYLVAQKII